MKTLYYRLIAVGLIWLILNIACSTSPASRCGTDTCYTIQMVQSDNGSVWECLTCHPNLDGNCDTSVPLSNSSRPISKPDSAFDYGMNPCPF